MFKKGNYKGLIVFVLIAIILLGYSLSTKTDKYPTLLTDDYNGILLDEINHYNIKIEINPVDKTYSGEELITYVNNTGVELNELFIHIYPNTFKVQETAPFLFDSFKETYPDGFKSGYIDINEVSIDKKKTAFEILGRGNTLLKIPLNKPLHPKDKLKVNIKFFVQLPPARDRFGYGDNTFNFGNWYPIVCVYNEKGWDTSPYYNIGDPFYSDTSNYDVKIIAPKDLVIASSGNIKRETAKGNKKIWHIEGKLIRDFAWVASDNFTVLKGDVEGTELKMYFLGDNTKINEYAYEAAKHSLEIFNRIFGKYPYGQYSVVATNFPSGMEYPGLVFIGDKYYNEDFKDYLEKVIVHETAHQWWYGVVGNNEIEEAWLDESFATYSEIIYIDEIYNEGIGKEYFQNDIVANYEYMKEVYDFEEIPLKPLNEFKDWNDYGSLVYQRGAMFINEIKNEFGKEVLYDILNEYYNKYKFINARTENFIAVCEKVTGTNFKDKVNKWLYGER